MNEAQSLANKIHKVNPQFKAKFVKLFGRKLRKKSSWTLDYNFLETSIKSNSLKKMIIYISSRF